MDALWNFLIEIVRGTFWIWRVIQPDQAGVRTFCGKHPKVLDAGFYFLWPVVGEIRICKISEMVNDVRSQSLTTKDGRSVAAGISVAHSVINPYKAMFEVQDSTEALLNEALRVVGEYVSSHTFDECGDAENMVQWVLEELRKVATERWGLKVWRVGRSDWSLHRAIRLMNSQ